MINQTYNDLIDAGTLSDASEERYFLLSARTGKRVVVSRETWEKYNPSGKQVEKQTNSADTTQRISYDEVRSISHQIKIDFERDIHVAVKKLEIANDNKYKLLSFSEDISSYRIEILELDFLGSDTESKRISKVFQKARSIARRDAKTMTGAWVLMDGNFIDHIFYSIRSNDTAGWIHTRL